jgi:hypothetical protein
MLGEKSASVQARRRIICPNDSSFSLSMKTKALRLAAIIATIGLFVHRAVVAQSLNDPLLDRLIGTWVLRGDIAHKPITHVVKVQWVLAH